MRIYTTAQGMIRVETLPELWHAQCRYLLTTLRNYHQELPKCIHCALAALRYLSDPPGRDTWRTPKEAFTLNGDDCEGLTNILCAILLVRLGSAAAFPVLAKFGDGRVIHAVAAVHKPQLGTLERFAWPRYPVIYPKIPADYVVVDPSWICGMGFPDRFLSEVILPAAGKRWTGQEMYCQELPPCN